MKILNTVQNIWSQCLYCPLCKDVCRDVVFIADASHDTNINVWEKIESNIIFSCQINNKNKSSGLINFNINCLNNSFEFEIIKSPIKNIETISCQLIGTCAKCNNTFSITSSFILDFNSKKISNIGIDKDNIILSDKDDYYNITLLHYCDTMLISKCKTHEDGRVTEQNAIDLPIMKLDFANPKRVINKIKTLLLFS